MSQPSEPETARADKVIRGIWRLRLPLPWDPTPHGNAYAVRSGDGIVLFDTGYGGDRGLPQLELGLRLAGLRLEDVRLVVCTHAHSDHFGCAASIVERVGCPLWVHPAADHVRASATDPDAALDVRLELARRCGVPEPLVAEMDRARRGSGPGFDGFPVADRALRTGVKIETDRGAWITYEAPGHAPSHVVFHQPDHRILISGDVVVGRVFLYFDVGHTPDPVGEFLSSLDVVERLDVGLCLSGHGKPFRDVRGKIAANRREVARQLAAVRDALSDTPRTPFELIGAVFGTAPPAPALGYALEMTRAYLIHLERLGAERRDNGGFETWSLT
jgi:glyoxylase-like metal-dependent hydrolase (beta-lactamase superfamily II)